MAGVPNQSVNGVLVPNAGVKVGTLVDQSGNAGRQDGQRLSQRNDRNDYKDGRHNNHRGGYDGQRNDRAKGGYERQKYYQKHSEKPSEVAHDPNNFALGPYAQNIESMPEVSDDLRFKVRDISAKNVLLQLGVSPEALKSYVHSDSEFGNQAWQALTAFTQKSNEAGGLTFCMGIKKQMEMARLFQYQEDASQPSDPASDTMAATADRQRDDNRQRDDSRQRDDKRQRDDNVDKLYLLGKHECVAVPVRADFDSKFEQLRTPAMSSSSSAPPALDPNGATVTSDHTMGAHSTSLSAMPDCDGPEAFAGWFWVLHEGAPNIGETDKADDFFAYSMQSEDNSSGRARPILNEDMFLESVYTLWRLALLVMTKLGVEDCIIFPFGMGAFIRHLGRNDERYMDDKKMRLLRKRMADRVMKAIASLYGDRLRTRQPAPDPQVDSSEEGVGKGASAAKAKAKPKPKPKAKSKAAKDEKPPTTYPLRMHLCLAVGGSESTENHNVFIEAASDMVKEYPGLLDILRIQRNVDVLQLAHDLAFKATQPLKVGILNGANRKLLGNHWFSEGARSAIDENLHRRSSSMTRASLLFNMGVEPVERRVGELKGTLQWLGGKTEPISYQSVTSPPTAVDSKAKPRPETDAGAGVCACCKRRAAPTNSAAAKPGASKGKAKGKGKEQPKEEAVAQKVPNV